MHENGGHKWDEISFSAACMLTTLEAYLCVCVCVQSYHDETKEGIKMNDNWMCIWTTSVSVNLS